MNKITLALLATTALGLAACNTTSGPASPTDLPPGSYEKTTESVDAQGTKTSKTTTTDVTVDADGKKKAVVSSETTKDPKGLLNKTTTNKTEAVVKEK